MSENKVLGFTQEEIQRKKDSIEDIFSPKSSLITPENISFEKCIKGDKKESADSQKKVNIKKNYKDK